MSNKRISNAEALRRKQQSIQNMDPAKIRRSYIKKGCCEVCVHNCIYEEEVNNAMSATAWASYFGSAGIGVGMSKIKINKCESTGDRITNPYHKCRFFERAPEGYIRRVWGVDKDVFNNTEE